MTHASDDASDDALHFSRLKLMAKSAAHYALGWTPDTKSKGLGRAVHSYLLGDEDKVVLYPGARRAGKEYEAWLAEQNPEATVLIASEMRDVIGMRESIKRHKRAMALLCGKREQKIEWEWLGRKCAGTPDVFTRKRLVELKTTRSADPRQFPWDARRLFYHAQCAWYINGLGLSGRSLKEMPAFIVAVESSPPYPVVVYDLTPNLLEQGLRLCRLWMERLAVCEADKTFPGYVESDVTLDVPSNDLDLDLSGLEEIEEVA